MKKLLFILIIFTSLVFGQSTPQGDFTFVGLYEGWCQNTTCFDHNSLAPWDFTHWSMFDIVYHFPNPNMMFGTPWVTHAYGGTDSVYFWNWSGNPTIHFPDSLIKYCHLSSVPVILCINAAYGQPNMWAIMRDSVNTDAFCDRFTSLAEAHNYDGVDWNLEGEGGIAWSADTTYITGREVYYNGLWTSLQDGNQNHTPSEGAWWTTSPTQFKFRCERFVRRLRHFVDLRITTFISPLTQAYMSGTMGWEKFYSVSSSYILEPYMEEYFDKISVYQGAYMLSIQDGDVCPESFANVLNWHAAPVYVGDIPEYASYTWNMVALSNERGAAYPISGCRAVAAEGWDKTKIMVAGSCGGGNGLVGTDTLFGCMGATYNQYISDLLRYQVPNILSRGGVRHFDEQRLASYISGTATSNITPAGNRTIYTGEKFFLSMPDSTNWYYMTQWLIQNGYGGINPFSFSYDLICTESEDSERLKTHFGAYQAILDEYGTDPVLTISSGALAFGTVTVGQTSAEQTFTVSGINLTPDADNVTVTALTGYEVSLSTGTGFASSVLIPYTYATLSETTVYVHFIPTNEQSYNGNCTISGGGDTDYKAVTGAGEFAVSTDVQFIDWRKPE